MPKREPGLFPDVGRLKQLEFFSLHDLESVRLMLRGDSVVDWHRLNLETTEQARTLLSSYEFDPDDASHRRRLEAIKRDAIAYLRRQFDFPIPSPVERASIEELLLIASGKGHRQLCACSILKAMHIIHHLDGRELLFCLPMSDQQVFQLVEEKVYRVVGGMLSAGFPIVEFVGGRKNRDSLYTKLLSKKDASASQVYDKVRFRIVTRTQQDILPVLHYLTERLFPFSMVLAGESINTIFHFRTYCQSHPHLSKFIREFQTGIDDAYTLSDNTFSGSSYRVIHFVVDLPVRLPTRISSQAESDLGPIIFVLCEFQIVDQITEAANELGDASHDRYKGRQRQAVKRRLKIGVRPLQDEDRKRERGEEAAPASTRAVTVRPTTPPARSGAPPRTTTPPSVRVSAPPPRTTTPGPGKSPSRKRTRRR
jgi:uncharacterized protein (TIGR04552 family)